MNRFKTTRTNNDYRFDPVHRGIVFLLLCLLALGCASCAKKDPSILELMPAPDVYYDENIDPFSHLDDSITPPYFGMLYGTDRLPDDSGKSPYLNKRGFHLRVGLARIELGDGQFSWEEARKISLLKNRPGAYPLKVTSVNEFGILDRSFTPFTSPALIPDDPTAAARQFADLVNAKLALSENKDIYIYVHGYKVVFENPILVATELWHFLGYDGVFIAYAWPSTPKTTAYVSDLETAALSSHNLRIFIEYLAQETDAENIHIIGYSAGTRVVLKALSQLALIHTDDDKAAIQKQLHLGRVVLVGSDLDRQLFCAYLEEGILKVPENLSVYVSKTDNALDFSKWVFSRERLGQMWSELLSPHISDYLNSLSDLAIIDVTGVQGSAVGNGHGYFRKSPWVSSDILMALMHDLEPEQRGLVRSPDHPVWLFPEDYVERLRTVLGSKSSPQPNGTAPQTK